MANFREWQYMQSMGGSTYLFKLKNSTIVDATQTGAITRFINHSCRPNCQTRDLNDAGDEDGRSNCHVGIFALRDIAIGEELFYNY
ncbi:set domain-containing, partial [Cystoisospora suis]